MINTPEAEDILRIHFELVDMFKEDEDPIYPPGPKNEGLVYSAAERPKTGIGRFEKYDTVETKAAALFHSLVQNHPFHNGNKRTALISMLVCLGMNGKRLEAVEDHVFDFVVAVAAHTPPFDGDSDKAVESIAAWIRENTRSHQLVASTMKVSEFLSNLEAVGCRVKENADGFSWVVYSPDGKRSIKFSQKNGTLDGRVVKTYLSRLGLSQSLSGFKIDEFQEGIDSEQDLMSKYRAVLVRLAHA